MTEQEKQELSKAVASKYGIAPNRLVGYSNDFIDENWLWLHDDSARCFDLMAEHNINLEHDSDYVGAIWIDSNINVKRKRYVLIQDHPTKQEATRIAILKALLAKD